MEAVLEWGKLAPFPKSARGVQVKVLGGMFTREFRASFTAPQADIEAWLQRSPGPQGLPGRQMSEHVRRFRYEPGGGAEFAEVVVDDRLHQV